MHTLVAMLLLAATLAPIRVLGENSITDDVRRIMANPQPQAEGCVATTLGCNATARGRLSVGDCTLSSNGTFFDVYTFSGVAGKVVTVDVRPLSVTYTNPTVILVPPAGDASKTPLIFGPGGGVATSYVLSSSGTWSIAVGTTDLFASGEYFVSIRCEDDDAPTVPQNCVYQSLLCGQSGAWYLTSQSCRFGGSSANRLYAPFYIYAVAGDVLSIEEQSSDFNPLFGLYDEETGNLIASSSTVTSRSATGTFSVPRTGFYDILATSTADLSTGFFDLKVSCFRSGCLEPLALSPLQNSSVPYGGRATLTFDVSATEPLTINWLRTSPDITTAGTGRTIVTPPLFITSSFQAEAMNPCGSVSSSSATVFVQRPRHRAVRH
ncbi:MAG: hypothetical protein JO231_24795 [Acidobacteria bacterium]|nr:hypothetical protein [Acidobacteriota bacterium]